MFVYAAFLKPGRHQVIVHDQMTETFWVKNIVVDNRNCDILMAK